MERPTYRAMLRMDSIEARRAAGLEESITSMSRQRYTSSLHRDDNILGSLVTHGYVDAEDPPKDEVDVSFKCGEADSQQLCLLFRYLLC